VQLIGQFHAPATYSSEKQPLIPINRGAGRSQNRCGMLRELQLVPEIHRGFVGFAGCSSMASDSWPMVWLLEVINTGPRREEHTRVEICGA
jgi:hypothetical protein